MSGGVKVTVLQKYFASEIIRSVAFVLAACLALFAFFDLMGELKSIGHGGYQVQHAFLFVLMGLPGDIYDLMPIAVLIGTIWALAQFASRSEFTIMRVSSMSTWMAFRMLIKIGLLFVVMTFVFGEFVSPAMSEMANKMKLQTQGSSVSKQFRSGLWAKDVMKAAGLTGDAVGTRFFNVHDVTPDGELHSLKLYEFDSAFRMTALITADSAKYLGANTWHLMDVSETRFPDIMRDVEATSASTTADAVGVIVTRQLAATDLVSEVTPEILSIATADPNRMSAIDLSAYTKHLAENKQNTDRYEIAFWKKIFYPFAVLVMMALALPFAYMHVRAGGVSLKIFVGIMVGVSFYLINSLFSHLGLLNTWPALMTALLPSMLFLLLAISALMWVERH